jgi:CheY-like chemotaxis protein
MEKAILIVEDDPDGQELIIRMLFRAGIPVEAVSTGEDALQFLSIQQHFAIVLDLALPGIDGFEVLRCIRENSTLVNLPCIAVTAFHTPTLKQRVIQAGFDYYFPKPVDDTRFLRTVQEIVTSVSD